MVSDTFSTEDIVAVKTSIDCVVVAMTTENTLRRARRTVGMGRCASRDVSYLITISIAAVTENINWVRRVHAIVVERVENIVGASSIEGIQDVREKTVAVH